MKTVRYNEIAEGIAKVRRTLTKLTSTILLLNKHINMFLTKRSIETFTKNGSHITGKQSVIVCFPTAGATGDPFTKFFSALKPTNDLPILLKVEDPQEQDKSIEKVVCFVVKKLENKDSGSVSILRWAPMVPPFEEQNSIIVGTRFSLNGEKIFQTLSKRLGKEGMTVLKDEGLYGGGRIAYKLTQVLKETSISVVELTVCENVARDLKKVMSILMALSS